MTGALGVAAFVVVVLELVAAAGAALLLRRFWRQVEPQVRPLLSMLAPAKSSVPERIEDNPRACYACGGLGGEHRTHNGEPCPYDPAAYPPARCEHVEHGRRCVLERDHAGEHGFDLYAPPSRP